jgi:hypothetical protein
MNTISRGRNFFEEDAHPAAVTFDDGERCRRNIPWSHFRCADWDYPDPTAIRVEIGDWLVVISGHNLQTLYAAIETARLKRVRAHPEFADDPAHEADVFATNIRFIQQASGSQEAQLRLPI